MLPPAMRPVRLQDPLALFLSTLLCSYLRFPKIVGPSATLFHQGICCRGPLLWVQSPRQILALSLTKCRSLWVDYCGSVALCCSGLVAVGRYLIAVGWSCVFIGRCGTIAV